MPPANGRGRWIRQTSARSLRSASRPPYGEAVARWPMMCCAPPRAGRAPANCMARNWKASGARTRGRCRRPTKDPGAVADVETWLPSYAPTKKLFDAAPLIAELQPFRPRAPAMDQPACQWRLLPASCPPPRSSLCRWREHPGQKASTRTTLPARELLRDTIVRKSDGCGLFRPDETPSNTPTGDL